jgi:hypothetical protein
MTNILAPISQEELRKSKGLPTPEWSSDHLSLCCDLKINNL